MARCFLVFGFYSLNSKGLMENNPQNGKQLGLAQYKLNKWGFENGFKRQLDMNGEKWEDKEVS